MGDLSAHFSRREFACQCGCGFDEPVQELVDLLEAVRAETGPVYITSGCRCTAHNLAVGGVLNSAHTRGKAADIACTSGKHRHGLVRGLLKHNAAGVGIARTFVHADTDLGLPRPAIWTY